MSSMTAAPFKAILKFVCGNLQRPTYKFQINCTVSDVNAAYYLPPDGGNDIQLPSVYGAVYLVDVILAPAYGTDTTTANIFANGKTTGEVIQNAANTAANLARQFIGAEVGFQPGTKLRIQQVT